MKRNSRLDILRLIAISMVVLMHSQRPYSNSSLISVGLSYMTAPGLVLFFMISGALLLGSSLSAKEFLNRRFNKIVFPTIFWSLFYLIADYVSGDYSLVAVLKSCLNIPLDEQGHGFLWFMYTLSGLYLLTPILSSWLKRASKHEIEFYLLLWGITLIYPYLRLVLQVDETKKGLLYYFAGYAGYYLLGYYLTFHYVFKRWHVFISVILALLVPFMIYITSAELDFYSVLWYLSLPVALMAFIWFSLIDRLPDCNCLWMSNVANLCFGVYFIHIFIIRKCIWNIAFICNMPGIMQLFVISFVSLIVSFAISWIISKLSFSKYIIGV
jgi:surface polysaccharide O-acyltransferase-like enzyme